MKDCIFCKIVKGEIPCYKIYEDDKVLAFLDIANDVVGHTLVIPKQHAVNVLDASADTLHAVIDAVQKVSRHYVDNCGFDGVNTFNCNNLDAEQSVFHLHFHVIPRKKGDGVKVWKNQTQGNPTLQEVCDKLKLSN